MRLSFPVRRRMGMLLCATVWLGATAAALVLWQQAPGTASAAAIAQVKEYPIASTQLGRLVALEVLEGELVRPGQVVARLETELIRKELSVAEAQLQHASTEIAATGVSLDTSRLQAERSFESELEAVHVELQHAHGEYEREQAELNNLLADIRRERDLVKSGLARSDRLATLDLRRTTVEESVKSWPSRIQTMEAHRQAAQLRLDAWQKNHVDGPSGAKETQLLPVRARVKQERQSIELLRTQLNNSVLRAGTDAYVSLIHARPGDVLRPGDPIVTLVATAPQQVTAYIEEHRHTELPVGSKVVVKRRTGLREQFTGGVIALAGEVSLMPQRLWPNPHIPSWGRAVYVSLPAESSVAPGEMLDVLPAGSDGVARILTTLRPNAATANRDR